MNSIFFLIIFCFEFTTSYNVGCKKENHFGVSTKSHEHLWKIESTLLWTDNPSMKDMVYIGARHCTDRKLYITTSLTPGNTLILNPYSTPSCKLRCSFTNLKGYACSSQNKMADRNWGYYGPEICRNVDPVFNISASRYANENCNDEGTIIGYLGGGRGPGVNAPERYTTDKFEESIPGVIKLEKCSYYMDCNLLNKTLLKYEDEKTIYLNSLNKGRKCKSNCSSTEEPENPIMKTANQVLSEIQSNMSALFHTNSKLEREIQESRNSSMNVEKAMEKMSEGMKEMGKELTVSKKEASEFKERTISGMKMLSNVGNTMASFIRVVLKKNPPEQGDITKRKRRSISNGSLPLEACKVELAVCKKEAEMLRLIKKSEIAAAKYIEKTCPPPKKEECNSCKAGNIAAGSLGGILFVLLTLEAFLMKKGKLSLRL